MAIPNPSTDFIDTLRFGATLMVAQLTLFEYSESGSITNTIYVPCSGANITCDRNSAIRRSGSVTVELTPSNPPPALLPTAPPTAANPQPLAPFGNEIGIALGIATGNASPATVGSLVTEAFTNATSVTLDSLTNGTLAIGVGSTIVIGGAAPVVVNGITGFGPYIVSFETIGTAAGLSQHCPVGTSVQVTQFVDLGQFTITTSTVDATALNLVVTLNVSDRSFILDDRKTTGPYTFPATKSGTYEDEVTALLTKAWGTYPNMPPLKFSFSNFNNPIVPTSTYSQGSSPWQMALDLAAVAGNELYIDQNGIVTSHSYPNVSKAPVRWFFTDDSDSIFSDANKTIASGSPYTVPVAVQVTFTRDGIVNDVYITGSGSQNAPGASASSSTGTGTGTSTSTTSASPVLGHKSDNSPGSATWVEGPLGDLPEFTSSNLVPTASQAQAMASLDLSMSISSAWQIQVTSAPNPLIDVDDVVSVYYPNVGVNGPNGEGLCMVVDTVANGIFYADTTVITGRVIPGRYA